MDRWDSGDVAVDDMKWISDEIEAGDAPAEVVRKYFVGYWGNLSLISRQEVHVGEGFNMWLKQSIGRPFVGQLQTLLFANVTYTEGLEFVKPIGRGVGEEECLALPPESNVWHFRAVREGDMKITVKLHLVGSKFKIPYSESDPHTKEPARSFWRAEVVLEQIIHVQATE